MCVLGIEENLPDTETDRSLVNDLELPVLAKGRSSETTSLQV